MPAALAPHASPPHQAVESPKPRPVPSHISVGANALDLDDGDTSFEDGDSPPRSLLSPAFTPPSTPGSQTPRNAQRTKSIPVDSSSLDGPGLKLLDILPEVECVVRARIPTTAGQEMFLHLYTNNIDKKEHLAIVFGPHIRSRSLDRERPGETEMDRMIRGAYSGRLYPGRTTSKVDDDHPAADTSNSPHLAPPDVIHPPQQPSSSTDSFDLHTARTSASPEQSLSRFSGPDHVASYRQTPRERPLLQPVQVDKTTPTPPLVRIHSECYTGETVWSARCDCGEQLDEAARLMSLSASDSVPNTPGAAGDSPSVDTGSPGGVIIYLRQEGRGIGLSEKLKAYNLQDLGSDTIEANLLLRHPADKRSYGLATAMLMDLGLGGETGIRLMTNNPDKIRAVEGPNREVRVRERVPMVPLAWKTGGRQGIRSKEVESYLRTKIEQFGHMIGGDA